MAPYYTTVCGVMAVILLCLGNVQGEDCQQTKDQLVQCMMVAGNLDFNRLEDESYRQELCREVRPMLGCVSDARATCPDLDVFEEGHVDTMVTHLTNLCAGYEDQGQAEKTEDTCADIVESVTECYDHIMKVDDPLNLSQMCPAGTHLVECLEELKKRCSGHQMLEAVESGLNDMREELESKCANAVSCSDLVGDLHRCSAIMTSAEDIQSEAQACQLGYQMLDCMDDVQVRCAGHPAVEQMEDALIPLRDELDSTCVNQASEDEEEMIDADHSVIPKDTEKQCTRSETKFYKKLGKCHDYIAVNLKGEQYCQALTKAISCVDKLMGACSERPWMTDSFVEQMAFSMDGLRATKVEFMCKEK